MGNSWVPHEKPVGNEGANLGETSGHLVGGFHKKLMRFNKEQPMGDPRATHWHTTSNPWATHDKSMGNDGLATEEPAGTSWVVSIENS